MRNHSLCWGVDVLLILSAFKNKLFILRDLINNTRVYLLSSDYLVYNKYFFIGFLTICDKQSVPPGPTESNILLDIPENKQNWH